LIPAIIMPRELTSDWLSNARFRGRYKVLEGLSKSGRLVVSITATSGLELNPMPRVVAVAKTGEHNTQSTLRSSRVSLFIMNGYFAGRARFRAEHPYALRIAFFHTSFTTEPARPECRPDRHA